MKQSSSAKKFWDNIPGAIQVKLLNNVWCSTCRDTTGVAVEKMNIKKGDLIITGQCIKCSSAVARLIEGDGSHQEDMKKSPTPVSHSSRSSDIFKLASYKSGSKAAKQIENIGTLRIESFGTWNPINELLDDIDEEQERLPYPFDKILAAGERPCWKMENVMPGHNPGDFDCPIGIGVDMMDCGDWYGAIKHMKNLIARDERCLDAYSHLGYWYFEDDDLVKAKHFYKLGVAIGLKSIAEKVNDVFPWGVIDNRPFFRSLYGLGITLYRERNVIDAMTIFQKMIWLNPRDNQGARFLIEALAQGVKWEDYP